MKKFLLVFISCSPLLYLHAQNDNANAFVSFNNEGQTFGINNTTGIKASVQVTYTANVLQWIQCVFVNTKTGDTLLIVARDDAGFIPGLQHTFSSKAKLLFYYKIAGRGILAKLMNNEKNEIKPGNNFSISKFENKQGAIVEGNFAFTDLAFQNGSGQTTARIKKLTNGSFRATINNDIALGNSRNTQLNNIQTNKEQFNKKEDSIFTTLEPNYVTKRLFKTSYKNKDGYYKWKPNFKIWFDSGYLSDDGYAYTKYDTALNYNDGADKTILFFATPVYANGELQDCHACGALMSCAVFIKQTDNTYLLSKLDTNFNAGFAWGAPQPVALIKIGANKYAIASTSSDMHQGYYEEGVTYFETENFNTIFTHQTADDNTGAKLDNGTSSATTFKYSPSPNSSDYYLIEATTSGTEENKYGKIVKVNRKEIYYFDATKGQYVQQQTKTAAH